MGLSEDASNHVYEERIVIFLAHSFEEAIDLAERDASDYSLKNNAKYSGYCNAYKLDTRNFEPGTEVYSVMREVPMLPDDFVTHYYDDGSDKHS
jgi:hypothetical protein